MAEPMLYYTHNVLGTVNLIEAMRKHNVKNVRSCFLMIDCYLFFQCDGFLFKCI